MDVATERCRLRLEAGQIAPKRLKGVKRYGVNFVSYPSFPDIKPKGAASQKPSGGSAAPVSGSVRLAAGLKHLSAADFSGSDLRSSETTLVMAYSAGCHYCKVSAPALESLAAQGDCAVALVNLGEEPRLKNPLKVRGVPVFLLYRKGREHDRIVGAPGPDADSILQGLRRFAAR